MNAWRGDLDARLSITSATDPVMLADQNYRLFAGRDCGVPSGRGILERIESILEEAGIEFLGDPVESPSVRLRAYPE